MERKKRRELRLAMLDMRTVASGVRAEIQNIMTILLKLEADHHTMTRQEYTDDVTLFEIESEITDRKWELGNLQQLVYELETQAEAIQETLERNP